jgi:hypothetical protein
VRSVFNIGLLSLYLFTGTGFSQLLRMPELVEHFVEHCQGNAQMTWAEFFHMHYEEPAVRADNHPSHHHLPFKSMDANAHSGPYVIDHFAFAIPQASDHSEPLSTCHVDQFRPCQMDSGVWQPPRMIG